MAPVPKSNNNFKEAGKIKLKVFHESDFLNKTLVGRGGFGEVFKASTNDFGEIAVKQMLTRDISKAIREMLAEFKNMVQLTHHPNMVTPYGTVADDQGRDIGLVMEWMEGGSLHNVIQGNTSYNVGRAYSWFLDASKGLNHLHEQGVVHRDVKPLNMLLQKDLKTLKICDLGLSKAASLMSRTENGTPAYMAPEQLMSTSKHTSAVDVYALAISWWQMLTRRDPYDHLSTDKQWNWRKCVAEEDCRPEIKFKDKEAADMMRRMWHTLPEERPTMKEVICFAKTKADANSKTPVKKRSLESQMEELTVGSAGSASDNTSSSTSSSSGNKSNLSLENWMTKTTSVCHWVEKSTLSGKLNEMRETTTQIKNEVEKIPGKRKIETVTDGLQKVKNWMNDLLKVIQDALRLNPNLKLLVDYRTTCEELLTTVEQQTKERIEHLSKKK